MGLIQAYYCLNLSVNLPKEVAWTVMECIETRLKPDEYQATIGPLHFDLTTSA
ncbi:hypothetical protein KEC48_06900 [Clostridium sp. C1]|uniref:hypothetical protein n=1 Tax=Clostridium sp. C1 TaxID=1155388 RepID=UPI001BACBC80|nr:hypothetical protein [Clostridium sp. C1]QUN14227.1 hypothetical protein KEC48_06900 [Clostridium sp. C1]